MLTVTARRVLTGGLLGAALLAGALTPSYYADAAIDTRDARPTVGYVGWHRTMHLTADGRFVRGEERYAPAWTEAVVPADQMVEVTDGACAELDNGTRPDGPTLLTGVGSDSDVVECVGADR